MALRNLLSLRVLILQGQSQNVQAASLPSAFWGVQEQQIRYRKNNRHWNSKWTGFRRLKMIKVELPNFREEEENKKLTPEEIRAKTKENGFSPGRPWMERPVEISSTGDVFEPYVPPEGDGRASIVSKEGAKQSAELVSKKSKTWLAFRKIRQFDEDFNDSEFAHAALEIYKKVHEGVAKQDKHLLRTLVTERAYPEVTFNMKYKTTHWKYLEALEPPRVVHARCTDIISKENVFAQVTCRFHTKQILAVYDRFGRLAHGSEVIAKDVLEYVVFENHLANEYGIWRIHAKLIPPWMHQTNEDPRTFRVAN